LPQIKVCGFGKGWIPAPSRPYENFQALCESRNLFDHEPMMRKEMLRTCVSMPAFDRFIFYILPLYEFSHGLLRGNERRFALAQIITSFFLGGRHAGGGVVAA
jgi:hypothetical protein